jgi:hypothetical protein
MTRIVAPRVVTIGTVAARALALIGISAVIALVGFVTACDRVVDLTPFYDAPPPFDSTLGRADGALDGGAPPDGGIAFPFDGAFPDGGNPFPGDGNSDGPLVR